MQIIKSSHFSFSTLLVCVLAMFQFSCVDLDFDTPPGVGQDPGVVVNTSIAELKAMHTLGSFEEITDDLIFAGTVISNDEAGNFFKQLVLQDSTGGIELRIELTDLHNLYPVGRKVYVKAKGLWLGDYNELIQLGAGYDAVEDELLRIPESLLNLYLFPAETGNPIVPKNLTLSQINLSHGSTLVRFDDVQFIASDAGQTWADVVNQQIVNLDIEDCAMRNLIVRTSGYASFAGEPTPTGKGSITGILSVYRGTFQLTIRDLNDVMMTGARCGETGGTGEIDESFDSVDEEEDILLPGWSNIAVKGTRRWRAKVFMGNHYAQATAFGDTQVEMETWLITPPITLDQAKKLTFESAKQFYVHSGLTVWISTDFNGSNMTSATWTQLNPVLAGAGDADHVFIPSGDVNLSGFTGPVRIGFKYTGSGPNGQTTSFRVDNIKVAPL